MSLEDFKKTLNDKDFSVVAFTKGWPRKMEYYFNSAKSNNADSTINFLEVTSDNIEIVKQFKVSTFPTILFLKKEIEVNRTIGFITDTTINRILQLEKN